MSDWVKAWELIDEQRQVIQQLAEALRFYGDVENYRDTMTYGIETEVGRDEGQKAREALAAAEPYLQKKVGK